MLFKEYFNVVAIQSNLSVHTKTPSCRIRIGHVPTEPVYVTIHELVLGTGYSGTVFCRKRIARTITYG